MEIGDELVVKLSSREDSLGRVVATKTVKSAYGESTYNVYENSGMKWKEGVEVDYVGGSQRVVVTTKAVD
ncbi:hypothetical protein [Bacillus thuringiensis]|uniref:hypothetical protein n=1 Tax=Bacillus thuringiensis TaxID=1428 RepID=UPI00211D1F0F|nr:hypothetical protein [Bacillus thuringiensis]